ncbi:hypothetical protein BCV72DRAFT_309775 [Rhizopus microsporus var. microsporus]|uniref:La-domain-containing protein n=2 Tax=Rhizopus microsporus TaxID=58291 RepID=A0A2G4SP17_RHIZD|nr:uncharacterized protein RHIMIDRAFT_239335 [Rhizopus microsporus ATCC 52813]ORE01704.1 hypothetical protein BCV72DRAFT_309775 [Rhizopus microsporus var. microsporus]PHZ10511.1 hypothetical protein RHIMIDRAFT_239335 [Rhizopus microsporus ATCC 52813]
MSKEERQHKIINVLETYFSDASLLWDKIMVSKITADPEGFVSFDTLSKLQKFKAIEATPEEIKECSKIRSLNKLKLSEDETRIARIKPFIPNKKEELDEWSIYVEGLTKPYVDEASISELFTKLVGRVSFVRIPENKRGFKQFQGFCFVEFDNKECVDKAIKLTESTDNFKLKLRIIFEWNKYKEDYLKRFEERKQWIQSLWQEYNNKQQQENSSKMELDKEETTFKKGVIVFVDHLDPKCSKTTAIELLQTSGVSIAFMTPKKKGLTSVHIRLESPEDAQRMCDYFENHPTIQENEQDKVGKASKEHSAETLKLRVLKGKSYTHGRGNILGK